MTIVGENDPDVLGQGQGALAHQLRALQPKRLRGRRKRPGIAPPDQFPLRRDGLGDQLAGLRLADRRIAFPVGRVTAATETELPDDLVSRQLPPPLNVGRPGSQHALAVGGETELGRLALGRPILLEPEMADAQRFDMMLGDGEPPGHRPLDQCGLGRVEHVDERRGDQQVAAATEQRFAHGLDDVGRGDLVIERIIDRPHAAGAVPRGEQILVIDEPPAVPEGRGLRRDLLRGQDETLAPGGKELLPVPQWLDAQEVPGQPVQAVDRPEFVRPDDGDAVGADGDAVAFRFEPCRIDGDRDRGGFDTNLAGCAKHPTEVPRDIGRGAGHGAGRGQQP